MANRNRITQRSKAEAAIPPATSPHSTERDPRTHPIVLNELDLTSAWALRIWRERDELTQGALTEECFRIDEASGMPDLIREVCEELSCDCTDWEQNALCRLIACWELSRTNVHAGSLLPAGVAPVTLTAAH
jgi:hypothetical protein